MAFKNVYLPKSIAAEVQHEAQRLDRTVSWLLRRAWQIARRDIQRLPGELHPGLVDEDPVGHDGAADDPREATS